MLDKIDTTLLRNAGFSAYKLLLESEHRLTGLTQLQKDMAVEMTARLGYVKAFIPKDYPITDKLLEDMVGSLPAAGIIQAHFCHRWVGCGAPIIKMGHTYAAALMATDVPEDKSDIKPPYPFFYLEVPNNLLKAWDTVRSQWIDIVGITVSHYWSATRERMEWAYSTISGSGVSLYRFGSIPDELVLHPSKVPAGNVLSDLTLTEVDARSQEMIGRLILNACIAFDHSGTVKPPRKEPRPPAPNDNAPPPVAIYQIGKTLTLDCRASIRSYLMGESGGKSPSVISLVRGHWKNQRHGEKRSLTKRIWIEPYYRGPEGSILVRRD